MSERKERQGYLFTVRGGGGGAEAGRAVLEELQEQPEKRGRWNNNNTEREQ